MATLQGQYKNTNIETLLKGLDSVFTKHTTNLMNHCLNDVYNLKTAKGYGLDLWGKLLGFPRYLPTKEKAENIKPNNNAINFYEKNFYKVQFGYLDLDAFTYMRLTDDAYKTMLNIVLLKTTTDCSLESINEYCKILFTKMGGSAFIGDSENMEFTYFIFRFKMPDWFKYIIDKYDILPRAAGVGMKYFESESYYIGFKGQEPADRRVYTNFYRARFAPSKFIPKADLINEFLKNPVNERVNVYVNHNKFIIATLPDLKFKIQALMNFRNKDKVNVYSNEITYFLQHLESETETTPPTEPEKPPVTEPEKPTEKPSERPEPTEFKMIYYADLNKKLDSMNKEQLAYSYALGMAYSEIIDTQDTNNITFKQITQDTKDRIQEIYNKNLNENVSLSTLKQNAQIVNGILAQHIMYYDFMKDYDSAHAKTLYDLITPKKQTIQGIEYNYIFKDNVIDMSNKTYLENIVKWIPELDSIITRREWKFEY